MQCTPTVVVVLCAVNVLLAKPSQKGDMRFPYAGEEMTAVVNSTRYVRDENEQSDFVFPDDNASELKPQPCKEGMTVCEDNEGYPSEQIRKALSTKRGHNAHFANDTLVVELSTRIDVDDENPMCPSRESIVYPTKGQNDKNEWLFIINQDHHKQGVRVEVCLKPNEPCSVANGLPISYVTSCKQKFIYRPLVAVDGQGNTVTEQFRLPSCCLCHYRKVGRTKPPKN